jgi:hypothetical protein
MDAGKRRRKELAPAATGFRAAGAEAGEKWMAEAIGGEQVAA